MKKVLFSLMMIFVAATTNNVMAQETAAVQKDGAKIDFEKEVHDYGTIENGANGQSTFKFTNTGSAPLLFLHGRESQSHQVKRLKSQLNMTQKDKVQLISQLR